MTRLTKFANILIFIFKIIYILISYPFVLIIALIRRIFIKEEIKYFICILYCHEVKNEISTIEDRMPYIQYFKYYYTNPIYWLINDYDHYLIKEHIDGYQY